VADAEANAISRINEMLHTGVFQPPQPGENLDVHMRVAAAEANRWRGVNTGDPREANVQLIAQYIEACRALIQNAAQQAQMVAQQMGAPPEMGGEMGGMV
jgi:hypothetical protein